ncbi:MAG: HdeA/HdeB family chaperone [Xanthomonadales bacterium]|jgi:hypothetical protein|nr:HdeA/HdeB family chaperone [Xanthomonadales bacterium]
MSKALLLPTAAALIALLLSSNTLASDQRDFAEQSCKDVMRLSGADRDIALAFAHGYRLGKKGTTRYEIETLAQITDRFIDYCLDHPSENALQSFEKVAE